MRDGDLTRRGDTSAQRRGGRPSDGFRRASRPLLPGRRPGAVGTEPRPEQPRRRSGEAARHPRNHAIGMRRGDHGASTSPPSRRPPSAPLDPRLLVARRSTRLSATSDARHSDARPTRAHPLPPRPLSPGRDRRGAHRDGVDGAHAHAAGFVAPRPRLPIWTPPSTPATRLGAVGPPPPPRAPSPPTSSPPPNHDSASAKRAKRARRTSRDSAVFLSPRRSSTSTTTSTARTSPWRSARGSAARRRPRLPRRRV